MSNLLILGAGGHGKVVAEAALSSKRWNKIAFLDESYPARQCLLDWEIIGKASDAESYLADYADAVVAIGHNERRMALIQELLDNGFNLPKIIHSRAYVSPTAVLEAGTVVFAQVAINAQTRVGKGGIINTGATVDHDCVIAEGVHLSPGVHLAGNVTVGRLSWIGIGSSVKQQIAIGDNVIIGAGSSVIRDIPNSVTAVGVPSKIIKWHE